MRSLYKIVHTTCQTGWGEQEQRIYNESVWMENKGHRVVIIAPGDTPLFTRAKEYGFRVHGVSFKRFSTIKDYGQLKQIFKDEQPQILNTHGKADSKIALPAAKKTGVPCRILSRHISDPVRNTWYNRKIYKKLTHFIFTTSDHTTQHLQQVFKLKDMEIFSMPSGIITPQDLAPKDAARKALARDLCLDAATRFIGFAGTISKDRGVDTIIRALRLIQSQIPHHIAILGEATPDCLAELKTLAKDLGIGERTHFIGLKDDIWPYYRAFDCTVLASGNSHQRPLEGVTLALLEAMHSSCPVIGSKTHGITDIIVDKKTGLLFAPQNPQDLADMILETITNEPATLERVHQARELVKKKYTIDAMGRNIIRIYRLHQVKIARQYLV
jgi:glycosyltransferase involved in cell wall biosynthesis